MGMRIGATREGPPWPCPTFLELSGDGEHGLLPATVQRFDGQDYVNARSAATAAGWKEARSADGRPLFLGPCCSGRKA